MKKILIVVIIYFAISTHINAQEYDQVGLVSRFGISAGVFPVWVFPDLGPINNEISKMGLNNLSSSVFTLGGGGYAYIMLIDNLRLGGLGFGGSTSEKKIVNGFHKEVEYSYGIGGLTVEYTLPINISRFAISVGAIIGAGSAEIDIYQNKSNLPWDVVWNDVQQQGKTTDNINRKLKNSFFTFAPTLNVDIAITRFMAIRLGGGYIYTLNRDWKVDNDIDLKGVPSGLNSDTFFIQTGLLFGFFTF
ncbi:MAG: hypothetical protein M0P71_06515 [Melioribacteraceae bacterium]|nr:hypothetical protein [Melioribacteraceae bacterium]